MPIVRSGLARDRCKSPRAMPDLISKFDIVKEKGFRALAKENDNS